MPASGGHPVSVPDPGRTQASCRSRYWSVLAPAGAPFCVAVTAAVEV